MAAERQHRLDDRELKRLLDELARPESDVDVPGKGTLAERIDQLAVILRHQAAKAAPRAHPGRPGQRALVGEMLTAAPKLEFSDCRALALRDVLSRLGKNQQLQEETLAAADPHVARRVGRREHGAHLTPQGQAMWGAVNQRAVTLYRRATAAGIGAPETRPVAEAIGSIGTGVPLPADVRRKLEAALGVSLEGVRLHTGSVARDAAAAVYAEAFTVGEDIFFPGYDPASSRCQETLAHEVVHCIQWRQGRIGPAIGGTGVSRPDDPLEREAEHQAKSIVARAFHGPAEPARTPATGRSDTHGARPPTIDRQPAAFPVAMMLGPASPSASFGSSSAMVMRKYGGDGALDVSSWGIDDRVKDLGRSIEQAPPHIRAIGGEYAALLADSWPWIAGGLGVALGSAAIAHFYPPFAIANAVIQALLAAAGIVGLGYSAVRSVEAFKAHIRQWAITGWNALGKQVEIEKASIELAQAVTSLLAAAAALLSMLVGPMWSFFMAKFSKAAKSTASKPIKEVNPRPQLTEQVGSNVPAVRPEQTRSVATKTGGKAASAFPAMAGGAPEMGESIPEIKQENGLTIQLAIEQQLGLPRFSLTTDNNKALSRDVLDRIIKNYAPKGTRDEKTKILRAIELAQAEEDNTLAILQLSEKILKGQWRNLGINTSTFRVFGKGERVRKIVKREPEARDADLVDEQPNEKARKKELDRQRTYIRDYIIDKIDILKSSPHFSEYAYLNPAMAPLGSFTIDTTMVVGRTFFDLKGDDLTWAEIEVDKIVSAARQALGKDAAAIDDAPDNFRFHRTERKVVGWFDPVKVGEIPSDVGTEAAVSLGVHGLRSLGIDWRYVHPSPKLERLASSGDFWHALGGADDVTQPEQRAMAVKKLHNMLSIPGSQFKELIDAPVNNEVRKAFGHALSLIIKGDPSDRQLAELSRILREAVRAVKTKSDTSLKPFQTVDEVTKFLGLERDKAKGMTTEGLMAKAIQCLEALRDNSLPKNLPGLKEDSSASLATANGLLADLRKNGYRVRTVTAEFLTTLGTKEAIKIAIDRGIKDIQLRLTTWAILEELDSRFLNDRQASPPSTSDAPLLEEIETFRFPLEVGFFLSKHESRVRGIANNKELVRQAEQCVEALWSLVQKGKLSTDIATKLVLNPPLTTVQDLLTERGRLQTLNRTLAEFFQDKAIEDSIGGGTTEIQNITGIAWMTFQELERRFKPGQASQSSTPQAQTSALKALPEAKIDQTSQASAAQSPALRAWDRTRTWADKLTGDELAAELSKLKDWHYDDGKNVALYLSNIRATAEVIANNPEGHNDLKELRGNIYFGDVHDPKTLNSILAQEFTNPVATAMARMRLWNLFRVLEERLANKKTRKVTLAALEGAEYQPPPFAGGAPEPGEPPVPIGNRGGGASSPKALTQGGSDPERRSLGPSGHPPWRFQPMEMDSELYRSMDVLRKNSSLRKHERFDLIEREIGRILWKKKIPRVELDVRNIAVTGSFHAPTWKFIIQPRLLDATTLSAADVADLVDLVAHELTHAEQYYQIMRSGQLSKSSELNYRSAVVENAKATPEHMAKEQRARAQGLYDQLIESGEHYAQNQAVRNTYDAALRNAIAAHQSKAGDVELKDQAVEAAFQQYKALPEEAEAYAAGAKAREEYLAFVRRLSPVTGPNEWEIVGPAGGAGTGARDVARSGTEIAPYSGSGGGYFSDEFPKSKGKKSGMIASYFENRAFKRAVEPSFAESIKHIVFPSSTSSEKAVEYTTELVKILREHADWHLYFGPGKQEVRLRCYMAGEASDVDMKVEIPHPLNPNGLDVFGISSPKVVSLVKKLDEFIARHR